MRHLLHLALVSIVAAPLAFLGAKPSLARSEQPSSFQCRTEDGIHYTIALRSDGEESNPMIVWTSDAFESAGYPPQRRCEVVSDRLNTVLAENGDTLEGLYLTTGRVNGQSVICTVGSTNSGCNQNNLLFTLSGNNARNPEAVLENLSSRATHTSGNLIQESGGQLYVDLDELVIGHF
ncbi:MAG: COP23 domain-containing protein [Geitlerinemataceae cyanobacterium]